MTNEHSHLRPIGHLAQILAAPLALALQECPPEWWELSKRLTAE
jgi:hypothetical protein